MLKAWISYRSVFKVHRVSWSPVLCKNLGTWRARLLLSSERLRPVLTMGRLCWLPAPRFPHLCSGGEDEESRRMGFGGLHGGWLLAAITVTMIVLFILIDGASGK